MGAVPTTKKRDAKKDRRPERKERRHRLKAIQKKISRLGNGYLNDCDLKMAGVDCKPMSLKENALLPRFFALYQGQVDPPLSDSEADEYITEGFPNFSELELEDLADGSQHFLEKLIENKELPQEEELPPAPRYQDWGNFGFPDLVEIVGNPKWQLETAWDMPFRKQPHIKCMISTDAAWDDRLLYGEIITILGIIRQRLRTPGTRKHVDAPVLMYSFIESRVRVIEGNFNGKELVVRATGPYDLKDDDKRGYELSVFLAKWWYGDTTKKSTK